MAKERYRLTLAITRDAEGHREAFYEETEDEATMSDIALATYKLEQIRLALIDRAWEGGEGYEIQST